MTNVTVVKLSQEVNTNLVEFKDIQGKLIPCTTSLKISEIFNKRHDHILRDINNLIDTGKFNAPNFGAVDYTDLKGEKRPMYLLDKKFSTILIMRFFNQNS